MKLTYALVFSTLLFASSAYAGTNEVFNDRVTISDGKNGRPWNQWKRAIRQQQVQQVIVTLRKLSGGDDTFVNLRFENGSTFENGKQIFLRDNSPTTAQWSVNQTPNGRPLVLNAYNGVVETNSVTIVYTDSLTSSAHQSDNRRRAYHEGRPAHEPRNSYPNNQYDEGGGTTLGSSHSGSRDAQTVQLCQQGNYNSPRIELNRSKSSGGLFSGKYRVRGTVTGSCIEEAGYYEEGRLKQKFNVPYSARFSRQEFEVQVRSGRNGEIRVYTTTGAEDRIEVDSYVSQSRNNSNNNNSNNNGGLLSWP